MFLKYVKRSSGTDRVGRPLDVPLRSGRDWPGERHITRRELTRANARAPRVRSSRTRPGARGRRARARIPREEGSSHRDPTGWRASAAGAILGYREDDDGALEWFRFAAVRYVAGSRLEQNQGEDDNELIRPGGHLLEGAAEDVRTLSRRGPPPGTLRLSRRVEGGLGVAGRRVGHLAEDLPLSMDPRPGASRRCAPRATPRRDRAGDGLRRWPSAPGLPCSFGPPCHLMIVA